MIVEDTWLAGPFWDASCEQLLVFLALVLDDDNYTTLCYF